MKCWCASIQYFIIEFVEFSPTLLVLSIYRFAKVFIVVTISDEIASSFHPHFAMEWLSINFAVAFHHIISIRPN